MAAVLLRIARYRASLELTDPELLIQQEFRDRDGELDLRLSTYEFQSEGGEGSVVQVHAEHSASLLKDPPRGQKSINLAGLRGNVVRTAGDTKFRFTSEAHREVLLADDADLRDLAAILIRESDREWLAALEGPDQDEWRRQVKAANSKK